METRAVEESFSWTPRSRKTFVREVPLLSRGGRSGLSRSGKTEKTGREGGGREGQGRFWRFLETAQIHWRRRNFAAGPWGSFMGSHKGTPPPLSRGWFGRVGVSGEGIKRWGIEESE